MNNRLTKEEVITANKRERLCPLIGLPIMLIGGALTALILSFLLKRDDLIPLAFMPFLMGLGIILLGIKPTTCPRCNESYRDFYKHSEKECLSILKAKLEEV